jgi:outer membrane receptor for ferrienterochelin and colicins
MNRFVYRLIIFLGISLLAVTHRTEAQQALPDLTLEELMGMDAGRVFGASERLQPVTEAPASVSFITAQDIERYGYRTLADILRGVRGMYITDDRNFSLVGTRGFGRPGDYNSRILLLINGHRVNDNVFGQAEVGAEFGLDPAMFERVEIIRGPASAIYGDSAFFAVINVITRSGASLDGSSIAVEGGTLGTRLARVSTGERLASGLEYVVTGTVESSKGIDELYFPAFDAPETNNGIAQGLDGEHTGQFYSQLSFKDLTFTAAYGRRRRTVPTASFGTLFNAQEAPQQTTDRHTLADVEYLRSVKGARVSLRASFDRFSYDGTYPFADPDNEGTLLVGQNGVVGTRWSAGTRITRPLPGRQVLTVGAEFIDNIRQHQKSEYISPALVLMHTDRSSTQQAIYLQDEVRLARWLIVNGGLRHDRYQEFVRTTPRAGLIAMPSANQSFKYLYGSAFRAPNAYELNTFYFGDRTHALRPESIDTHELVWERYTNDWLRSSVSTYWYKANQLITLVPDATTFLGTTFVNEGQVRAHGVEFEAQMRLTGGVQGMMSYSLQRARDVETGEVLVNSPSHMAKARMSVPGPLARSVVSAEFVLLGSRRTIAGNTLSPAASANVTLLAPLRPSVDLVGSIRNVFDQPYADPASDSHRQDSIPQNGRTYRVGIKWSFGGR